MRQIVSVVGVVFWATLAGPASAQMANGQSIAEQWCANCHGAANSNSTVASDAAPPFSHLSGLGADQIRGVLNAPHEQMRGIDLTRQQIDLVIEYIIGLDR